MSLVQILYKNLKACGFFAGFAHDKNLNEVWSLFMEFVPIKYATHPHCDLQTSQKSKGKHRKTIISLPHCPLGIFCQIIHSSFNSTFRLEPERQPLCRAAVFFLCPVSWRDEQTDSCEPPRWGGEQEVSGEYKATTHYYLLIWHVCGCCVYINELHTDNTLR